MGKRMFSTAEEAAGFAATIVSMWQTEGGELWDIETLTGVAACADGESGLEEGDAYIVDENGAIGLTRDGGRNIYWWVTPAEGAAPRTKPRFCPQCGRQLRPGDRFCDNCGARAESGSARPHSRPDAAPQRYGETAENPGLVGFSDRYRDPRILAFKEKEKKRSGGCLLTLAALVPVGTAILGFFGWMNGENDLGDMLFLAGLSLVPAAVLLLAALIRKAAARREKPMWEGTIIDKTKKQERDYHAERHREQDIYYYTRYILHVRTDDGKKKTFSAIDDPAFFGYYQIGDRIRYHPVLEYYEKYDKSRDNMIFCACCRERNPIGNDTCEKCGMPLFK